MKSGGSWSTPVIIDIVNLAGELDGYLYVSLVLDSSRNMHVCYFNWRNGDLKHAWKASGTWNTEVVEAGAGYAYSYTAVVVDPGNTVHVLYTNCVQGIPSTLKYVAKTGTIWSNPTDVDPNSIGHGDISMAIDSQGNLHAVCDDTMGLKYAMKAPNGNWTTGHIIDKPGSGSLGFFWTPITLDFSDNVHISYSTTIIIA